MEDLRVEVVRRPLVALAFVRVAGAGDAGCLAEWLGVELPLRAWTVAGGCDKDAELALATAFGGAVWLTCRDWVDVLGCCA